MHNTTRRSRHACTRHQAVMHASSSVQLHIMHASLTSHAHAYVYSLHRSRRYIYMCVHEFRSRLTPVTYGIHYVFLGSVFSALIPYCGPSVFWGAFCIPYCVLRIPHIILGPDLYCVLCICTMHDSQLSCVNSHPLQQFGSACVLRIAYPYCVFRCVG